MTRSRKEQFSGCLVGQCLGDALGAPVEGYPQSVCRQYVNRHLKPGHLKDDIRPRSLGSIPTTPSWRASSWKATLRPDISTPAMLRSGSPRFSLKDGL
jgi:hypothetical protein